ncbi:hypothetical protein CTEN210_11604 [Chaetoceros tenuissimus]|uniref:Uncharacterized protein n=1 Tax=Chaetoceros tenuissimus TaxID=426638 RepID=A0AAD3H9P7_9STRA|nr:hypothetical protein CTEN210_11604 [Chaetoceros tenuissimus]
MDIATLQSNLNFIKSLYFHEEWKDEECRYEILEAIEECNQKIEKAFGSSMHFLYEHKPSFEAVEKVVKKFPSTLSYETECDGQIPIQWAATSNRGYGYVPILAKEGVKHKVGGEDARGGMLMIDPDHGECNTLQLLCYSHVGDNDALLMVNVLKELRRSGILVKKDIQEHCLLRYASQKASQKRFTYLVEWDPDALMKTRYLNEPLIHGILKIPEVGRQKFAMVLEASLKHFPSIGGLLFIKDSNGTTAFDAACSKLGTEETMAMLHDILSPKCNYPILHHALVKAPEHKDLFMEKFPWAYQLKDHNGRTLQQAVLAAGPDVMKANKILFATLTDDQIRAKDPETTLYPFAAMAVGEHADLEKTFYLLRRHPSVLDLHTRTDSTTQRRHRNENSGGGSRKKRKVEK